MVSEAPRPTPDPDPWRPIESGRVAGLEWRIIPGGLGYLCGYVVVPPGHPWHGRHREMIAADVHGGVTHSRPVGAEWLVGFDCGHAGDGFDPRYATDPGGEWLARPNAGRAEWGPVRDVPYVRGECAKLCLAASRAASAASPPLRRARR